MSKKQEYIKEAQGRLKAVATELDEAFPERGNVIRGALTALLAGEHVLLLGPPGTAKSLLARKVADAVSKDSFFEILLTKFTAPEEVFGPVSFSRLKQDKYERMLAGYAATKKFWFLDEIFKSSSAILNSFLTAMNERKFHNGGQPVDLPLAMVVAASNEYPQDESLKALYDRFSFKFWVDYISDRDQVARLLTNGGVGELHASLDLDDLHVLQAAVCEMELSDTIINTLLDVKAAVEQEGFVASDRTWVKAVKIIKARAVLSGRNQVIPSDLLALSDVLWKEHKDRDKLNTVIGNAADPYAARAVALIDGIRTAMGELPDFSLLENGTQQKTEHITKISQVNTQVASRLDAAKEALEESPDNEEIKKVVELAEKSIKQITEQMNKAAFYRPVRS